MCKDYRLKKNVMMLLKHAFTLAHSSGNFFNYFFSQQRKIPLLQKYSCEFSRESDKKLSFYSGSNVNLLLWPVLSASSFFFAAWPYLKTFKWAPRRASRVPHTLSLLLYVHVCTSTISKINKMASEHIHNMKYEPVKRRPLPACALHT